jgi:hypothetical protein
LQGVLDLGDVFVVVGLTTAFHVIKKNVGPLRGGVNCSCTMPRGCSGLS